MKRLTPQQSRQANALIRKECCNYFDGNCILLDDGDSCVCPQTISYSLLCKWFKAAVLPLDETLLAELDAPEDMRICTICNQPFFSTANKAKYCQKCKGYAHRRQKAEHARKTRQRVDK